MTWACSTKYRYVQHDYTSKGFSVSFVGVFQRSVPDVVLSEEIAIELQVGHPFLSNKLSQVKPDLLMEISNMSRGGISEKMIELLLGYTSADTIAIWDMYPEHEDPQITATRKAFQKHLEEEEVRDHLGISPLTPITIHKYPPPPDDSWHNQENVIEILIYKRGSLFPVIHIVNKEKDFDSALDSGIRLWKESLNKSSPMTWNWQALESKGADTK